jgi:hypothetical protein
VDCVYLEEDMGKWQSDVNFIMEFRSAWWSIWPMYVSQDISALEKGGTV